MTDRGEALGWALQALVEASIRRRRNRSLSLTASSTLDVVERTGPRRITELAQIHEVTQPSMTALVNQLVRMELVERRPDAADGRVVLVAITPAGQEHLGKARRTVAAVLTAMVDKLPEDEAAALHHALPAIGHVAELLAEGSDSIGISQDAKATPERDADADLGAYSGIRTSEAAQSLGSALMSTVQIVKSASQS